MKMKHLLVVAGGLVLTSGACNLPAAPVIDYRFEPLHFNLTFTQSGLNYFQTSSNGFASTPSTYRVGNKNLLALLATAFDTNWPAGANLAQERAGFDLFVVDATGTNPVFNLSSGINVGFTNVTYFRFTPSTSIPRSHKLLIVPKPAGRSERYSRGSYFGMGYFQLFKEQNGTNLTDLSFAGLRVTDYSSTVLESNTPSGMVPVSIHFNSNMNEIESVTGEGTLDGFWTIVQGQVTGSLKLKDATLLPPRNGLPPTQPPLPPPIIFTNPPIIIITNRPPPIIIITSRPPPINIQLP